MIQTYKQSLVKTNISKKFFMFFVIFLVIEPK